MQRGHEEDLIAVNNFFGRDLIQQHMLQVLYDDNIYD
jgi:hypothetical protein